MTPSPPLPQYVDVVAERDFLACVVELVDSEAPSPIVERALAALVARTDAKRAYLELGEGRAGSGGIYWASSGFETGELEAACALLSTTIIADALAGGRTIESASAIADPRFAEATSVQRNNIEAVLCVPIGTPPVGVIYLQGHAAGMRFPAHARAWTERFAAHLRPIARRLVQATESDKRDPTLALRARLKGTEALLGKSASLAAALRMTATVAPFDLPVLITGPSGSGKSELARIITQSSRRANKPLVTLNCAAIPDTLLESELFGAMAGAHSTATKKVAGKVETAAGGTLVLDEVSELSPAAQAKLLQLLQDGTYWPLGATRAQQANVRVIAATNANLPKLVSEGRFREDLFYRLNVVLIELPGLDERRSDIPLLADAFIADTRDRHSLGQLELSEASHQALVVAEWPGNVRQLANTLVGAALRAHSEGAPSIEPHHIFPDLHSDDRPMVPWQFAIREFQRRLMVDALAAANGNITEAARRLGIGRSHAFQLVSDLGLRDET